jgi:nucleotide-binding universal stress UspA family protein
MGNIVVGIDGSACAAAALRWAKREADLRDDQLHAVLVWDYLSQPRTSDGVPFEVTYDEQDALRTLEGFIRAAIDGPSEDIVRDVVCDLPAAGLLARAADASLLVTGARGLSGFRKLVLGSVSERVLHEATCSVVIVPEPDADRPPSLPTTSERIVVATDGSPTAERAVRWTLEEGRLRSATVQVVHAWHEPLLAGGFPVTATVRPRHMYRHAAQQVLDRAVDAVDPVDRPEKLERILLEGPPAPVILEHAEGADLVVVGSRGLSGLNELLLGSVSRQLVHRAPCPIVVIKPAERLHGR